MNNKNNEGAGMDREQYYQRWRAAILEISGGDMNEAIFRAVWELREIGFDEIEAYYQDRKQGAGLLEKLRDKRYIK